MTSQAHSIPDDYIILHVIRITFGFQFFTGGGEKLGERREGEVYRVTGNTGISHR